jgi:Fic family protein
MSESDLLAEMKEIKKWVRIQGLRSLEQVLSNFNDRDLVMYESADGETTTTEIGNRVGLARSTVSTYMNEWSELGIVEKKGQQWKHIAPLSALGIEEPEYDPEE